MDQDLSFSDLSVIKCRKAMSNVQAGPQSALRSIVQCIAVRLVNDNQLWM